MTSRLGNFFTIGPLKLTREPTLPKMDKMGRLFHVRGRVRLVVEG